MAFKITERLQITNGPPKFGFVVSQFQGSGDLSTRVAVYFEVLPPHQVKRSIKVVIESSSRWGYKGDHLLDFKGFYFNEGDQQFGEWFPIKGFYDIKTRSGSLEPLEERIP